MESFESNMENMPQVHHMRLNLDAMDRIRQGEKKIEVRLNDKKRQAIKEGDIIEFIGKEDDTQVLKVRVAKLLPYATFAELVADYPSQEYFNKGKTDEELLESLVKETDETRDTWYTKEQEKEYGVLGIMVEPLDS